MIPKQSHARAQIMLKHGEPGWIHRRRLNDPTRNSNSQQPWKACDQPLWDWALNEYCAVRIEKTTIRTPLPIEHYRRGMEVMIDGKQETCLVLARNQFSVFAVRTIGIRMNVGDWEPFTRIHRWRWPNETEWHPAFTETTEEREVEKLEVEG